MFDMEGTNAQDYRVFFPEIKSTAENVSTKVATFSEEVTITGSYVWRIQNFSWEKLKQVGIIESEIFHTSSSEDLSWRMSIENCGGIDSTVMRMQVSLQDTCKLLKAKYMFYILDENLAKTPEGSMPTMFSSNDNRCAVTTVSINYLTRHFSNILLPDGHLNILCEVTARLEPHRCGISKDFELLLESGRLSDVTLVVNKVKFSAHMSVLASRSPVFALMFENNMIESREKVVEISDIEPEVMKELLRFIYTDKVENLDVLGLELFAAADKYALEDLKRRCENELYSSIDAENAVALLICADLHGCERLKIFAQKFIVDNAEEVVKTAGYKTIDAAHLHLLTGILSISK